MSAAIARGALITFAGYPSPNFSSHASLLQISIRKFQASPAPHRADAFLSIFLFL
jgi:hypothetical protein